MRISRLSAAAAVGIATGLMPGAAVASCGEFPPIEDHLTQADVVFVGTVARVQDEDRTAVVVVHETWVGPVLPATVTVHGAEDLATTTTADRVYSAGDRYLFAVRLDDGQLRDSACTATTGWTEDLARLRPAAMATPQPEVTGEDGTGVPLTGIATVFAVMAIGAVSVLAFRSRS